MEELIGCFYFKQTSNGNLIGEFSNNRSKRIYTESADKKKRNSMSIGNYCGTYYSTWQESGVPKFVNLNISSGTDKKIFALEWTGEKGIHFNGVGMLCDNILIGYYQ